MLRTPHVEIAEQHDRMPIVVLESFEQARNLHAAFESAQAQVRGDHAEGRAVAIQDDIDCVARFASLDSEGMAPRGHDGEPGQQRIAEVAVAISAGRHRVHRPTGHPLQVRPHVEATAPKSEFLQRHHIGAKFGDHMANAIRREAAVQANTAVHVPGGDADGQGQLPLRRASARTFHTCRTTAPTITSNTAPPSASHVSG